jgi:hypothetical protein
MPHLRVARRIDLGLVALLGLVMAGCLVRARGEQAPPVKRVVYLGIKNAPPALDQAVAERVDPGYARVSAEEYRETARKLNAEGMIDLDVARVAQALGADVIIHGEYVRKNRRRGQLTVTMRTAAIGAVVAEYVLPVRRGVITKRGARQLDTELPAELEALLGPPPAPPAEPASAVASAEPDPAGTAGRAGETEDEKPGRVEATPAAAKKPGRDEAAPAAAAKKPGREEAAPAAAQKKPGREEAAPAAAVAQKKPGRAEPAPAPVAQKPGRGAKTAAPSPGASAEPAKGQPDEAQGPPEPRGPAPVIVQDENGQVVDDEKPPALKRRK